MGESDAKEYITVRHVCSVETFAKPGTVTNEKTGVSKDESKAKLIKIACHLF